MAVGTPYDSIQLQLHQFDPTAGDYARQFVDTLLDAAIAVQASDVHLQPTAQGLQICWRLDGVLQPLGEFPPGAISSPIARLKVLADLLTYRTDAPQEGRIRRPKQGVELRVSTFPTLHGERAVVRVFAVDGKPWLLDQLQLPADIRLTWGEALWETSGALIITGPAGSGKTTTAYACLRQIVTDSDGGRSIVSLEDPIETAVAGVSQSQVHEPSGFTLASGLRSLLRQDPQVIFVGEIRDREAAYIAFQAALTGQLVITTFHAGTAAEAVSRLCDMGIESYLLRSGVNGILGQRLVRKICKCKQPVSSEADMLGLPVRRAFQACGCPACHHTGYRGRLLLAEMLVPRRMHPDRSLLLNADATDWEALAVRHGMQTRWDRAIAAVEDGLTSPNEIRRVLGLQGPGRASERSCQPPATG